MGVRGASNRESSCDEAQRVENLDFGQQNRSRYKTQGYNQRGARIRRIPRLHLPGDVSKDWRWRTSSCSALGVRNAKTNPSVETRHKQPTTGSLLLRHIVNLTQLFKYSTLANLQRTLALKKPRNRLFLLSRSLLIVAFWCPSSRQWFGEDSYMTS